MTTRHCVGVLALQGAFKEHCVALEACGATAVPVRTTQDFAKVQALVIPGGESTTMGTLLHEWDLFGPVQERGKAGMPLFGTCAGLIMLCADIEGYPQQPHFGLLDASVQRNAFGRQIDSFETDIVMPVVGPEPVQGVFIRAPVISHTGPQVRVLAQVQERIVAVQQGAILATAFHPELTADRRLHQYFLTLLEQ